MQGGIKILLNTQNQLVYISQLHLIINLKILNLYVKQEDYICVNSELLLQNPKQSIFFSPKTNEQKDFIKFPINSLKKLKHIYKFRIQRIHYYCYYNFVTPFLQNSKMMEKLGFLVQAPRNITMLGCLKASIAWHSLKKSFKEFSLFASILNILIATVHSLHFPQNKKLNYGFLYII